MTKTIEAKAVREARAEARRLARRTPDMTYQQALDHVAREAGSPHWSGFVTANPADEAACKAEAPIAPAPTTRGTRVSNYVRSLVTGRRAAEEDRLRSAAAVHEAEEFAGPTGLWYVVALRLLIPSILILLMGALQNAVGGVASTSWAGVLGFSGAVLATNAVIFASCLAMGDHPGMEHRRAQVWAIAWWIYVSAFLLLLGGGIFQEGGLFGMTMGTTATIIVTLGLFGGTLRDNLHTLMALGATLGPASPEGSSIADLATLPEATTQRVRPAPLTPEMARQIGRRKPWHKRIGVLEIGLAVLGLACILAVVGAALTLMGLRVMGLGYAALLLLSPFIIISGIIAFWRRIADLMHFTQINGLGERVRRISRMKRMQR